MKPTSIRQTSPESLSVTWNDGHESTLPLRKLRDRCPCAGCKGETVLLRTYTPPPPDVNAPGRYTLVKAEAVGSYAMRFSWGDGHQEGLYTWETLRLLCECENCVRGNRVRMVHP
jgi:DUF971 family protein